tara:strand:+ start:29 stop:268 length:240 start_codon:yes stop_codon:yes gene_type:complete
MAKSQSTTAKIKKKYYYKPKILYIMTKLEKAAFVLEARYETPSEEIGGKIHIDVSEYLSVAIHDEEVEYLAEQYNELNQ